MKVLHPASTACSAQVKMATVHTVWWKMHHSHPQSVFFLVSQLMQFSDTMPPPLGTTQNISTSLCQTPFASQGGGLWWTSWEWQTDNGWMLHFSSLAFFLSDLFFFDKEETKASNEGRTCTPTTLNSRVILQTHLLNLLLDNRTRINR